MIQAMWACCNLCVETVPVLEWDCSLRKSRRAVLDARYSLARLASARAASLCPPRPWLLLLPPLLRVQLSERRCAHVSTRRTKNMWRMCMKMNANALATTTTTYAVIAAGRPKPHRCGSPKPNPAQVVMQRLCAALLPPLALPQHSLRLQLSTPTPRSVNGSRTTAAGSARGGQSRAHSTLRPPPAWGAGSGAGTGAVVVPV